MVWATETGCLAQAHTRAHTRVCLCVQVSCKLSPRPAVSSRLVAPGHFVPARQALTTTHCKTSHHWQHLQQIKICCACWLGLEACAKKVRTVCPQTTQAAAANCCEAMPIGPDQGLVFTATNQRICQMKSPLHACNTLHASSCRPAFKSTAGHI